MGKKRPTKEDLSAFIYLTDQMLASDFVSDVAETGNIYKIIADEGCGLKDRTINDRSIRRAFSLRKNLKAGKLLHNDYGMPNINTLNTLTYFHFDKKAPTKFRVFKKTYRIEIEKYSEDNYPSEKILKFIFENKPEKLSFLDNQKRDLEHLLTLMGDGKFENLKQELYESDKRIETFQKKVNNDLKLQNDIIEHLKLQIERIEQQRKKSSLLYRLFGTFGLFLVSINYNEVTTESVLNDFMDNYEGLDEDEVLEDIV